MPRGRRLLPLAPLALKTWPDVDRHAWEMARAGSDPLDDPGLAAHWRAVTADHTVLCYGHWLAWLADQSLLDPVLPPDGRITRERVHGYLAYLRRSLAPKSIATMITRLHEAVRVMAPGADIGWLRTAASRLEAQAVPARSKMDRLVETNRLVEAGLRLMSEAQSKRNPRTRALHYRDGLLMAFLALRPIRLSNLAMMALGLHVLIDDDSVLVRFAGSEMKTHRPLEFPWPSSLVPHLHAYLTEHRPVLLEGRASDALWIGRLGPLDLKSVQQILPRVTKRTVGVAIPPHFFRDCAATTVALRAPEEVAIIMSILGHATLRTSERYYNHAVSLNAARQLQDTVQHLRRTGPGTRGRRPSVEG
ncbi:tyrosine-type recombinase/integrase [Azospirillum argentinense]